MEVYSKRCAGGVHGNATTDWEEAQVGNVKTKNLDGGLTSSFPPLMKFRALPFLEVSRDGWMWTW